jgi:hypothetical protein
MLTMSNSTPGHRGFPPDANDHKRADGLRLWLPFTFGVTVYLLLLARTNRLLVDSDIYWHIVVGQWIVDHRAVPHTDPFSFTMHGTHWITSAWLSEILYLGAFKVAGWAGPVILASLSVAAAFFLLTRLLLKTLPNIPVMILVGSAITITAPHMLARPHVLVFPLMVLWADAIVHAAEERRAPSFAYLPLMALWANLHGSFTLGLALIAPFALEALWTADKSARGALAIQWLRFGLLALGAACITPYGPESVLVTFRLLSLGSTLSAIKEWQPQDFGTLGFFEGCLLAGIAYVLYSGFRLPPLRIVVLLAVLHETLTHRRYVDVMALVAPFFIARPLAQHLSQRVQSSSLRITASVRRSFIAAAAALVVATCVITATADFTPPLTPLAAVEKIKEVNADRIFNEYYFGGYLIYKGIPTFVDSRAELYGATFLRRYQRAVTLADVADFVRLLDEYGITATLLFPQSEAVGLLDRMEGWERIYTNDFAVAHYRRGKAASGK